MEVASLIARFGVEGEQAIPRAASRAEDSLERVAKTADRTSPRIGNVFTTALGFAGGNAIAGAIGGVDQIIGGLIGAHAQAETYRQSLEIAVGSQERANQLFADVQKMASSTPFEFPELIQATTNLEAFGLSSQDWLKTIGDTASATNKSVDQVTQAVLDAASGEFERLKELGITTRVEGDKLTFSYMRNGEQITETVDRTNQAVINSTLQGIWSSKYDGAMQKQARTFTGAYSTLKDNIRAKAMEATGGAFSILKKGLDFANLMFADGWKKTVAGAFGQGTVDAIETGLDILTSAGRIAWDAIKVAGDLVVTAWDGITAAWGRVSGPLGDAWDLFTDLAGGMRDAFRDGKKVRDIVAEMPAPLRTLAEPLLTIVDSFGDLWRAYRDGGTAGFFSVFREEAGIILREGLNLGKLAVKAAVSLGGELADLAADAGAWLWKKVGGWGGIVDAGEATVDATLRLAADIGTSDVAVALGNDIVAAVEGLASLGEDVGRAVFGKLTSINWAEVFTVDSFNLGQDLGVALRGAVGKAVEAGGWVVRQLAEVDWREVPGAVAKGIVAAAAAAPAAALALMTGIASFVAGAFVGFAFGENPPDFDEVVSAVTGGLERAFDAVTDYPRMLVGKGKDLITGIMDGWTLESGTLSNWARGFGPWVLDQFLDLTETLWAKGTDLIYGIHKGVGDYFTNDFAPALRGFGGFVLAEIPDLSRTLYSLGRDLVVGMALGMYNNVEMVVRAATYLASQIPDVIKKLLGMSSPSKVMRDLFRHVPEGAALGVLDGLPRMRDAAVQMATASMPKLSGGGMTFPASALSTPTFAPLYVAPATAYAGGGQNGGGRSSSGPTYVFSGCIIGADVERWVEAKVASGAAKVADRSYARNRMGEAR